MDMAISDAKKKELFNKHLFAAQLVRTAERYSLPETVMHGTLL
jgi:hypothetical protein